MGERITKKNGRMSRKSIERIFSHSSVEDVMVCSTWPMCLTLRVLHTHLSFNFHIRSMLIGTRETSQKNIHFAADRRTLPEGERLILFSVCLDVIN